MATKVSFGFGRLSDTELDNFAQGVIDATTGSAAFPTDHERTRIARESARNARGSEAQPTTKAG